MPEVLEYFGHFPNRVKNAGDIQFSRFPCEPIRFLDEPLDPTFQCQQCPYIGLSIKRISEHCRNEHQWKNIRERGRNSDPNSITFGPWNVTAAQQFLNRGRGSNPFPVHASRQLTNGTEESSIENPHQLTVRAEPTIEERKDQFLKKVKSEQSRLLHHELAKVQGEQTLAPDPWIERVGFARYLMNVSVDMIVTLTLDLTSPHHTSDIMQQVTFAFDLLVRFSQNVILQKVNIEARFLLHRSDFNKPTNRPFYPLVEESTLQRYQSHWRRVLGYIIRTQSYYETDLAEKLPRYSFNQEQAKSFKNMINEMQTTINKNGGPVKLPEVEKILCETDEATTTALPTTVKSLLSFVITLIQQPLSSLCSEFECPLLSSIAVMSLKEDSTFSPPQVTTPVLSGLVKIMRLLSLAGVWVRVYEERLPASWFDSELKDFVERFLTVNHSCPMAWILQTRAYGLKVSFTTTSDGEVFWENDRLNYRHLSFTMEQFQEMVSETLSLAKRLLLHDVLLLAESELDNPPIPHVPATRMRDDFSCNEVGWWYGKLHNNLPFSTVDENETWLVSRVFKDPELRQKFIKSHHARDDQWNEDTTTTWLKSVYSFKEILLVLMHLTAGAPARGPELLSIRHMNSVTGGVRNQYIDNGLFSFVTRYHKG